MNTGTKRLKFSGAMAAPTPNAWVGQIMALSTNPIPIALTGDEKKAWVVNRGNDSMSVLNVEDEAETKLAGLM